MIVFIRKISSVLTITLALLCVAMCSRSQSIETKESSYDITFSDSASKPGQKVTIDFDLGASDITITVCGNNVTFGPYEIDGMSKDEVEGLLTFLSFTITATNRAVFMSESFNCAVLKKLLPRFVKEEKQ